MKTKAPSLTAQCDNCSRIHPVTELNPVRDMLERIDQTNGVIPAGECPACGCLAYIETAPRIGAGRIVIVVEGGCVQSVYADHPTVAVEVLDFDQNEDIRRCERYAQRLAQAEETLHPII